MIYHITANENTPAFLIHDQISTWDEEIKDLICANWRKRGFIVKVVIEQ